MQHFQICRTDKIIRLIHIRADSSTVANTRDAITLGNLTNIRWRYISNNAVILIGKNSADIRYITINKITCNRNLTRRISIEQTIHTDKLKRLPR